LLVACSSTGEATVSATPSSTTTEPTTSAPAATTAPATTSTAPTTTIEPELEKGDLDGWETMTIQVGDQGLEVAVADTPGERAQGLKEVDDLGDLDGMLFVYPQEGTEAFSMRDTLIPLDIAFFGDGGILVDVLPMEPCLTDSCPAYVSSGPFLWALETPVGTIGPLDPGTILSVEE